MTALDLVLEEIEPGRTSFTTTVAADDPAPRDVCATLLDFSLGTTVRSELRDRAYRIVDLHTHRPPTAQPLSGPVRVVGETVRPGPRLVMAHARVLDARGRMHACGSLTILLDATTAEDAGPLDRASLRLDPVPA